MLPTGLLGEYFLPLGLQGVVVRGLPHPCSSSCSGHRGSLTPSRTGRRNQKMWVLPPPQVSGDAWLVLAPLAPLAHTMAAPLGALPEGQQEREGCLAGPAGVVRVSRALGKTLLPLNWLPWAWPVLRLAEGHSGKGCHQPTMP